MHYGYGMEGMSRIHEAVVCYLLLHSFCVLQGFVGVDLVSTDSPKQEITRDHGSEAVPASSSRVSVFGCLFSGY